MREGPLCVRRCFFTVLCAAFSEWGPATRARSIVIQLEGVSADPGAKGGDHLQVIRITGIPIARLDPTSRTAAGSQPLGKRG